MKTYAIMPLPKIEKGEIWQVPLAKLKELVKDWIPVLLMSMEKQNEKQNR